MLEVLKYFIAHALYVFQNFILIARVLQFLIATIRKLFALSELNCTLDF